MTSPVQVGVCDPNPMFRRGLRAALQEAGHHPVEVADVHEWFAAAPGHASAVVGVAGPTDVDTVEAVTTSRPDAVVVGVLAVLDVDLAAAVLRAGAASVVARDDDPEVLLSVLQSALEGYALLPSEVARVLANTPPVDAAEQIGMTPAERQWLRALAQDSSVVAIARAAGLSERTMYRRLEDLFRRIGAKNRVQAVAWAVRHGHLEDPPVD